MIKTEHIKNRGTALLVVLFIIMAVTILALGFLSRSDTELACGENMTLRTVTDYLAESGLEHARGLILNPQDVDGEYWTGEAKQQLAAGSSDYYDVTVTKLGPCNYQISSDGYRQKGTQQIGKSSLTAQLRLDPCIAFWAGSSWNSESQTTVNGDVYCSGNLSGIGNIGGDVFASGVITASNVLGAENANLAQPPIVLPGLNGSYFSSSYYIGTNNYSVSVIIGSNFPAGTYYPSSGNPAGVYYCNGDINLSGNVNISGMLAVTGNLNVQGTNNVITAVKNFPALVVDGELTIEDGATLEINGLAQVGQKLYVENSASNVHITVNGALFILNGAVEGLASSGGSTLNITAVPNAAAIQTWPQSGNPVRWSPAGGAFFRSIKRQ